MMKMKKMIALVLCAALLVCTLAACGGKNDDGAKFSRGTVDGNTYTNTFAGLKFNAPEDWTFSTEEEIDAMMGLSMDEMDASALEKKYAEMVTIYDMVATSPEGVNVIIMYQNLGMVPGGSSMSEQDYADVFIEQLPSQVSDITTGEVYTTEMAGKTFTVIPASVYDGLMFQDYYLLKVDNYIAVICFTNVEEPAATGLADYFTAA